MLVSLCITFTLATMATLLWAHWWQGGWGKSLTGVQSMVILPSWLLKSSSADGMLWWAFTKCFAGYPHLQVFCPFLEVYPHTSSQNFIVTIFFPQEASSDSDGKESACNAGDLDLIPGSGRSFGEGNGNPLWCSCLENPMDRGAWQATVHGIAKSQTRLSD